MPIESPLPVAPEEPLLLEEPPPLLLLLLLDDPPPLLLLLLLLDDPPLLLLLLLDDPPLLLEELLLEEPPMADEEASTPMPAAPPHAASALSTAQQVPRARMCLILIVFRFIATCHGLCCQSSFFVTKSHGNLSLMGDESRLFGWIYASDGAAQPCRTSQNGVVRPHSSAAMPRDIDSVSAYYYS